MAKAKTGDRDVRELRRLHDQAAAMCRAAADVLQAGEGLTRSLLRDVERAVGDYRRALGAP